jgi:hypothetical protein
MTENKQNTDKLFEVLDSMINDIDANQIKLFKKIIESSEIKKFNDYDEFYYAVIYPFENFITGFVKTTVANNDDVVFLIKNSQFIECQFEKIIIEKEGTTCCADKSKTIMRHLISFFITGVEIKFNYDGEYTYHLPKEIFNTHEHIIMFYEALKYLWFGDYKKYLEALKIIINNKN